MVGKISFIWHGSPITAVMGDDLVWSVPADPYLEKFLNSSPYYDSTGIGPEHGQPGRAKVIAAAEWLGGEAEFPPLPDEPPGRVY